MKSNHYFVLVSIFLMLVSCGQSTKKEEIPAKDSSMMAMADTVMPTNIVEYPGNISNEQTVKLVTMTLKDLLKEDLAKDLIPQESRKFIFFEYDLNGNGMNEIFVGMTGPYFCGSGGCTMLLLDNQGNVITKFTVADYPVVIDRDQKTDGWYNLFMLSGGQYHVMKFNGKSYPSNPSVEPVLELLPGDGLPRALNYMNEPYPWFPF